ncbi:MAG: trigger factor [Pseudomonadota bacterium]
MQVSIETLSSLERRMTIEVPAERVESQVKTKLEEAARNFHMKGFRKGKVPLKVIKDRFGRGVRQEVLGEVMSQSYYEALGQQKVKPASQPKIEARSFEEGKNLQFVALFEVYPEVKLADFSSIAVDKKTADINEADIDNMIETLRKQRQTWVEVDRAAQDGDQLIIDFVGKMAGEEFAGGKAENSKLLLGSKRMIEGFEAGLIGSKKGDEKTLALAFPETYHNKELAGKAVEFDVKVHQVAEAVLPQLEAGFFASFDIKDGDEAAFRAEVKNNMARELKNAIRNSVKNQVVDGLLKIHSVELPRALVDNEINVLRQQTVQQYGNNRKIDDSMLPPELFRDQAQRRVQLGLIMNEVIQQNQLKIDPTLVRSLVEDLSESYEEPQEVVKWYYSNKDQLAQVEAMALEESVIDLVLKSANINEIACSYEEALKPVAPSAPAAGE